MSNASEREEKSKDAKSRAPSQIAQLYFIHAISPLHAGVGEGLDAVNLPTAREQSTGYPFLPGSSVKGVLREAAELAGLPENDLWGAFGPPTTNAGDARGGLVVSDASLLALPVRSLFGTFAWVTCPYVLVRLLRDVRECGVKHRNAVENLEALARGLGKQTAHLATDTVLLSPSLGSSTASKSTLFLEELLVDGYSQSKAVDDLAAWIASAVWPGDEAAKSFLARRLLVLQDDLFGFLSRTAMEIRHRVRIDSDTGTAASSGPWTEEHMPAETLLHGVVIGRRTRYFAGGRKLESGGEESSRGMEVTASDALGTLAGVLQPRRHLRFGGKSTAGMGRARMQVVAS